MVVLSYYYSTMPSITYGGVEYIQIRHAIYCRQCKDTIESKSVHDFKFCSCGSVGIDGGIFAGNRILGNLSDIQDRSVYRAIIGNKIIWLPEIVVKNNLNKCNTNIST